MSEAFDARIETEILERGLNYPRVQKKHIDRLLDFHVVVETHQVPDTTVTVATAYLKIAHIKFALATEFSACIDPRNFAEDIGVKIAEQKVLDTARNKLWELEGYHLLQKMIETGQITDCMYTPKYNFADRLGSETLSLGARIDHLADALDANQVPKSEREILSRQLEVMQEYYEILQTRLLDIQAESE